MCFSILLVCIHYCFYLQMPDKMWHDTSLLLDCLHGEIFFNAFHRVSPLSVCKTFHNSILLASDHMLWQWERSITKAPHAYTQLCILHSHLSFFLCYYLQRRPRGGDQLVPHDSAVMSIHWSKDMQISRLEFAVIRSLVSPFLVHICSFDSIIITKWKATDEHRRPCHSITYLWETLIHVHLYFEDITLS